MAIDKNKIKNYVTPHDKGNGSGGVTYIHGAVSNGELPADLNVTSITAAKGNINILNGNTLGFDDGQFIYLGAQNGKITKISGSELNFDHGKINDFHSDLINNTGKITTNELEVKANAFIKDLTSNTITTEYLTVTKQAHFFELIIDKVRSVGGTLIMTQAQCIVDYAKAVDSNYNYLDDLDDNNAAYYDVFWLAQEDSGREVTNDWVVGDQAYCQSFNNVSVGANYDVSNKYYWRLVTNVLNDRYMNLNTGEELPLSASAQASVNSVTIEFPYIVTLDKNDNEAEIATGWNVAAQNIIPGVTWTADSSITDGRTKGTMTTVNTVFGIQMTPTANSSLANATPVKFGISCTDPARINIGIYYNDGSSNWFSAPERATDSYEYNLTTDAQIEAVVITNADEVEWKLVHGIRLSNTDCDYMLSRGASIPSKGDNIAQLGYRYDDASSGAGDDESRASAIIIAAYNTPDGGETYDGKTYRGLTPPSYAQYKLINDFHLSRHRHTFFDALGSEFYGKFYAGTGTNISQYQPLDSQAYHLFIGYANDDGQGEPYNVPYDPVSCPNGWVKSDPIGGQSYEFMGFCSRAITLEQGETEQDAIDRIEATLTFNNYDWSMVPGGTGTPGGHWVNAYNNTQSKTTAPTPPNENGIPKTLAELQNGWNGWYATPQTLPDGYYTWMSQAFIDGNGNMQLWQTAIRLTGADGNPGTDGDEIEFIYTRNNGDADGDPLTPPAPRHGYGPNQDGSYPDDWPHIGNVDHQTVTNADSSTTTWYDNPQGVEENMRYEYVSQRIKRDGSWSDYSSPVVWSSWGRKGQDGDGYEYIYARNDSTTTAPEITYTPNRNKTRDDDDFVPIGWEDDPQGVTSNTNQRCEWVAVRKKQNSNPWGDFSTPALWAQYVPPGSTGRNGSYTQFIYRNGATAASVAIPEDQQQQAIIPTNWSASATTPATGEFTWCSNRVVTYDVNNNPSYGRWETPYRITGDKGEQGADGDLIEFIYTTNNSGNAPAAPQGTNYPRDWPNDGTTDHQTVDGVTWYDNPQGVSANNRFEYVSSREYDGVNETWSTYSTPALWSKYGENGRDGDGYEYIYCLTATENDVPELWQTYSNFTADKGSYQGNYKYTNVEFNGSSSNSKILRWKGGTKNNNYSDTSTWHDASEDEYLPPNGQLGYVTTASSGNPVSTWTDEPQGVSINYKAEWVAVRKKENGVWGDFSTPTIWVMYGGTGPQGPQGPIGPQGVNGIGYKLIDWGSQAYYSITLDSNNNESYAIKLLLKFKVAEISGNNVRFLSPTEITDLPLFPYAKSSKTLSTTNTPAYYWRKFSFENDQATEAVCVYEWPTNEQYSQSDIQNLIKYNNNIYVALLPSDASSYGAGTPIENSMKDEVCIPLKLLNSAELQVTSGQNASIKALVTGQDELANNISSLTIEADEIQSQVTSLNQGMETMQTTITQMPNFIRSQVTSWYNESGGYAKTTTIDLTSQDIDTKKFYPVAVTLPNYAGSNNTEKAPRVYIKVCRLIDSNYGGPDYSTHTQSSTQSSTLDGFPFNLQFSTQPSGNGNVWSYDTNKIYNGEPLFINKLEVSWTKDINGIPKDCIAYKIDQNYMGSNISGAGNDEIIFLRGGSKYDISSTWVGSTITAYTSGYSYTHGNSSTFERPVMSYDQNIPYIKQDEMTRSEIIQTADQISLSVYSGIENDLKRTGIDITKGEIDLVADNTTVKGDLNIRSSNNGAITLYDNNDQPRINIKPQNVPVPTSGGNNFSSTGTISLVSSTVSGSTTTVTTSKVSLGNYSSGQSISLYIHPRLYGLLSSEGYYMENNAAQITCTAKIYRGSNTSASYTTTQTINRTGSNDYTAFTWNVNLTAGSNTVHKLEISIITAPNNGYSSYYGSASVTYDKIVDSLTYVGADGILVGTSINNFASITKDGFEFRWVKTGNTYNGTSIRMSDNGLQRANRLSANNNPVSWVAFDGHEPITVLVNNDFSQMTFTYGNLQIKQYAYIVKASDVNIFIDKDLYSSPVYNIDEVWILLGDGIGSTDASDVVPGRKIRIKNLSGKTVQIGTGYANEYIMDSNGLGLNDHIEANNRSFTIMSIPPYYINGTNYNCHWTIMHAD